MNTFIPYLIKNHEKIQAIYPYVLMYNVQCTIARQMRLVTISLFLSVELYIVHYSLFIIHYSLFIIHYSKIPISVKTETGIMCL